MPFNNTASHCFREQKGKGLKYKPSTQSLRIKEIMDKQEMNYLPNSSPKQDKLTRKAMAGDRSAMVTLNRTISKSLLPTLHAKTYFKSVSTLYNEIPGTQLKKEPLHLQEEGEETEERRSAKPKDHLSRKENSREVLVKCNMLSNVIRV